MDTIIYVIIIVIVMILALVIYLFMLSSTDAAITKRVKPIVDKIAEDIVKKISADIVAQAATTDKRVDTLIARYSAQISSTINSEITKILLERDEQDVRKADALVAKISQSISGTILNTVDEKILQSRREILTIVNANVLTSNEALKRADEALRLLKITAPVAQAVASTVATTTQVATAQAATIQAQANNISYFDPTKSSNQCYTRKYTDLYTAFCEDDDSMCELDRAEKHYREFGARENRTRQCTYPDGTKIPIGGFGAPIYLP